jgi:hypothetical protein
VACDSGRLSDSCRAEGCRIRKGAMVIRSVMMV